MTSVTNRALAETRDMSEASYRRIQKQADGVFFVLVWFFISEVILIKAKNWDETCAEWVCSLIVSKLEMEK